MKISTDENFPIYGILSTITRKSEAN